ncbi:uncharacterized protein LOC144629041 isoform X2 [Oculina patagonica]
MKAFLVLCVSLYLVEACPELNTPLNGAIACSTWTVSLICSPFCNNRSDFAQHLTSSMWVCGANGNWLPTPSLPDCSRVYRPGDVRMAMDLHYYYGNRSTAEAQARIKQNFIKILNESFYNTVCQYPSFRDKCKPENVKFTSEACEALGMKSGAISDGQISASSTWSNYYAHLARLDNNKGWASGIATNEWLQIDLGVGSPAVTKIATQGLQDYDEWVTRYKLDYGNDGVSFQYYMEQGKIIHKVFVGNTDRDSVVSHDLNPPITARYIRFRPVEYYYWIAMRVELYTCQRGISSTTTSTPPTASLKETEASKQTSIIIIGACVGGVLLLVIVIVAVVLACKRRNRCLHSCCFAEKPEMSSDSHRFRADNNVVRNNPVFGEDDLTLHMRSSQQEETGEGQAEDQETQETGEDSRGETDPVYSEISEIFLHSYENSGVAGLNNSHYQELHTANGRLNALYAGRNISLLSNSHYQELNTTNGRLNTLYAGLNNSNHSYENAVTQSRV